MINGLLGEPRYSKPPYRKQLISPNYSEFGSWESHSSIRSVGFPSGSRESGKYYYEVLLNEDPEHSLSIGIALANYAPRHDETGLLLRNLH